MEVQIYNDCRTDERSTLCPLRQSRSYDGNHVNTPTNQNELWNFWRTWLLCRHVAMATMTFDLHRENIKTERVLSNHMDSKSAFTKVI